LKLIPTDFKLLRLGANIGQGPEIKLTQIQEVGHWRSTAQAQAQKFHCFKQVFGFANISGYIYSTYRSVFTARGYMLRTYV